MAKAEKKAVAEKKEFAWDTEKTIGEFGESKKKTEVRICTFNEKTYVSAQSYVMSAKTGDWKRTKNNTLELGLFKDLQEMVGRWELESAFGASEGSLEAPKKAGGLKAKKQAEGAKEKAASKKKADKK